MARPARPAIPGLEVIEHEVPKNPNVVQGVSPQSEAWRSQQTANMGPQQPAGMRAGPPGMADRINGVADRIGDINNRQVASMRAPIDAAAAKVQRAADATRAVGGAVGNLASKVIANPLMRVPLGIAGGAAALSDADAARTAVGQGDLAQAASSGASALGNAATMLPGPAGMAGMAYTGGHAIGTGVDKVLQMSEWGQGMRDKIGGIFASGEDRAKVAAAEDFAKGGTGQITAQRPLTAGQPAAGQPQPAADPYAAIAASNAAMLRSAHHDVDPTTPDIVKPGAPAGSPTGNAPGTFRYGDGSTGTGTVSSLDMTEGARQDKLELARLIGERQQREAGFPGNQPGGGLSGIRGTTLGADLRAKTEEGQVPAGMSPFDTAQWKQERSKLDQAKEIADGQLAVSQGQLAVQRAGNDNALRVAEMNNDARRYDTDTGANVNMRGQDMTQQNNLIQRQIALGQRQYERFKDDRAYQLDLAKHGQAVADSNRTARESEEKSWQGMAEKRFVGEDGKPDTQKIARFSTAVDSTIPAFIKMLQQTGTPQALAKAKELSARGKAALGPEDHDLMQKLFEVSSIAEQSQGVLPGKGSVVRSQNLLDFMPKGKDTGLLGNPITVTNNGSRIPTNKLVYGVDDNAFLPTFEPKRSDLVSIR